jgi:type II secretory pathway pseudopilin PulG
MALREITNMRRRSAFTLVEVLVSMALILFIMSILAAAFGAASQAVSDLKAAGDLAEKLRGATGVLKRDLEAPHFTDGMGGGSTASLSQLDLSKWLASSPPNPVPTVGFFRIYQGQADTPEGIDLDGIASYSQVTTSLHYTIALKGTRRSDFLSASVPPLSPPQYPITSPLLNAADPLLGPPDQRYQDTPNEFNSQYAEVAVFLAPVADQTDGGTQLYALYRRQLLPAPPGWTTPTPVQDPAQKYLEVSTVPTAGEPGFNPLTTNLTFNTMQDLSNPVRRFWMQRVPPPLLATSPPQGALYAVPSPPNPANTFRYAKMDEVNANFASADLLMTDVLSFDVRVLLNVGGTIGPEFVDLFHPSVQQFSNKNSAFNQPGLPSVFDTWSNQQDALTSIDYRNSISLPAPVVPIPTRAPLFQNVGGTTIVIQAIQITLRVWDFKTKKTRQVTIVQQL